MIGENSSLTKIRVITSLIFVLGIVAGVAGVIGYQTFVRPHTSRRERFKEVFNRLNMNDTQRAEVEKVLGSMRSNLSQLRQEAEPKIEEIKKDTDQSLKEILSPAQWQQFQEEREKIYPSDRSSKKLNGEHSHLD